MPTAAETIATTLRHRVFRRDYAPGEQLPLRTELESQFACSRPTLQQALDTLRDQDVIHATPRRGTYVTQHPPLLYRFGLVFYNRPISPSWSLYEQAFVDEARRISNDDSPYHFLTFFGLAERRHGNQYDDLLRRIRDRELAGLLFPFAPHEALDTPILDEPDLPRAGPYLNGLTSDPAAAKLDLPALHDLALGRLRDAGKRHPVILRVPAPEEPPEFLDELVRRVHHHGLTPRSHWIQGTSLRAHWIEQLLHLVFAMAGPKPDSLYLMDDNLVVPAMHTLQRIGLRVPDDLYVVSHANFPTLPNVSQPIDYVGFPIHQVTRRLTASLIRMGDGAKAPRPFTVHPVTADQAARIRLRRLPERVHTRRVTPFRLSSQGSVD